MLDEKKLNQLTDYYLKFIETHPVDKIDLETAKKIYPELIDVINYHNYLYYVKAQPVISDWQYDKLYRYLADLEKKYPKLISPDSPTQRLNIPVQEEFKKAKHIVPLLSLDNSYDAEDLKEWAEYVERTLENYKHLIPENKRKVTYHIEPKFDGSSVELVYKNGKFAQAITRGDGFVGEDVTENVKTIHNLPMVLKGAENIKELRIRGEVLMPRSAFERLNKERQKQGLPLFANPRNAAAGSLRQLDPKETAKRGLIIYVYELLYLQLEEEPNIVEETVRKIYDMVDDLGKVLVKNTYQLAHILGESFFDVTQKQVIDWFKILGLPVYHWEKVAENIDEVIKICTSEETKQYFESQEIEFDGLVIKVNELFTWPLLGMTSHHPRWAIAYKFPAKQVATKLLSVDYQVGKSGIITPVANLEPVEIGGVIVSRASLHNFDLVKEKDVRVGDWVWVIRSGEVIPYVVGPIKEKRDIALCIDGKPSADLKEKYPNLQDLIEIIAEVYKAWYENFKNVPELVNDRYWHEQIVCLPENLLNQTLQIQVEDKQDRAEVLNALSRYSKDGMLIKILPPNKCPVCGGKVVKFPDEVYFYCSNVNCPAQIKERLKHFVSKSAMDIAGLGDKLIDMLVNAGLISHYADIYKLKEPANRTKLLALPLMGPKRVDELLKQIEESKNRPLNRLINALGIKYVGGKASRLIEEAIFNRLKTKAQSIANQTGQDYIKVLKELIDQYDWKQFMDAMLDRNFIASIYGIGEKTVDSLYTYLTEPQNQKVIEELAQAGVKFNIFPQFDKLQNQQSSQNLPLSGVHFSITGKFPISRSQIVKILEKYGASWDEQPKKTTDFILVGQDPGSKLQKAQKYGIKIISSLDELKVQYPDIAPEIDKHLNASKGLFDVG